MALQVTCLYCGEHFLLHSANIKIVPLELDWQRLEAKCPHCLGENIETFQPIKPQFDKPQNPVETAVDKRFTFALGAVVSNAVVHQTTKEGVPG